MYVQNIADKKNQTYLWFDFLFVKHAFQKRKMVKIGHRIQKIITLICLYVKPVLFAKKYKISTQASKTLSIKTKFIYGLILDVRVYRRCVYWWLFSDYLSE
jgi:hypothetical protein